MKVRMLALLLMIGILLTVGCASARLLDVQRELTETYYNLGNAHMRLGNHDTARQAYMRALSIDEDFHEAAFNLAIASCRAGAYNAAEVELARLIERDPHNTRLLDTMAWCLLQDGRPRESLKYYQQALKVDPGDSRIRESSLYVLMDVGKYQEARREAVTLLESRGVEQDLLLMLFEIDQQLEDASGYPWLEEAWKRNPSHERTAEMLLAYYLEEEDETAAVDMLKRYTSSGELEHGAELLQRFAETNDERKAIVEQIIESLEDDHRRQDLREKLTGLFE